MARSGSTLLRFILDSHPELACPPEACLGSACFMLARLWDLLEPSPRSAEEGFRPFQVPADLSDAARTSMRGLIDDVYSRYLVRHGKRRWCDKSLDNIGIAELLADLYPGAQFICLYRHCLDVIVSAVEACPWGLNGYGLERYSVSSPGNSVAAVAHCWLDQTTPIIEFQHKHADRCHGLRYEDLVTEPEQVAASLFEFLGIRQVPGITTACFTADHEIRGPSDHKIWFTGGITRDSLGQGIRVPIGLIPPEMLVTINETLAADVAALWPDAASKRLTLLVTAARGTGPARGWTISREDAGLSVGEQIAQDRAGVVVAATGATWLAIVTGQANLAAEERAGRLRFAGPAAAEPSGAPVTMLAGMRLLARLLGLTANQRATMSAPERERELAI
jgi:hypothetical protein